MTTTLSPDFLRAAALVTNFKGQKMRAVQAELLRIALRTVEFSACDLPSDFCAGNPQLSGCATGALVSIGLLEVCGRVKSSNPAANGRKVNRFRLVAGKRNTAHAWFKANNVTPEPECVGAQMELLAVS